MTIVHFERSGVKSVSDEYPLPVTNSASYGSETATILAGESLSDEIDISGYSLVGIKLPSVFEGSSVTFQASDVTGGTFYNVYDSAGNEFSATVRASSVVTDLPELAPLRFIKIRSGTAGTPVVQVSNREIVVLLKA